MRKHLVILSLLALFCLGARGQRYVFYNGSHPTGIDVNSVDSITYSMPENLIKFTTGNPTSVGDHSMTARFSLSCDLVMVNTSTARGVCYSKDNATPTTADKYVKAGVFATGPWTATLPNLLSGTKYYYRPYVRLGNVVFYGKVKNFTTSGEPEEPEESLGPDFVDLGLSVDWATYNVGTDKPEGYGNYYAWGETAPKDTYSKATYKLGGKYNSTDGKTVLDPEDDVATVTFGEAWRMPTKEEMDELCSKCEWTETELNGVKGHTVKGPSGNAIFIPKCGYREDGDLKDSWLCLGTATAENATVGNCLGPCWMYRQYNEGSTSMYRKFEYVEMGTLSRYIGVAIRPVHP